MKFFGKKKDSELFIFDENEGEWKKLDDKTARLFRVSLALTNVVGFAWLVTFFYTIKLLIALPNQTLQFPATTLLMLLIVSIGAVVASRRADYVILEKVEKKSGEEHG